MRILTLLITLLLPATAAQATPPQIVAVNETLLGVNDTHIFVLRTMGDNMGLYQPTQTDVVLIARGRGTNLDEQVWPVMRMIDHGFTYSDKTARPQVEPLPLKGLVNPFDILIERRVRPLLNGFERSAANSVGNEILVDMDALTIVRKPHSANRQKSADEPIYRISHTNIAALFTASLNATRDALPAYYIEGGDRGIDMLRDVAINPANDCDYIGFVSFSDVIDDKEFTRFWLTHITCENADTMADISMYFLVPKMP